MRFLLASFLFLFLTISSGSEQPSVTNSGEARDAEASMPAPDQAG
jgi:hypothetical protein